MEETGELDVQTRPPRPKVAVACEACRAAKLRCQASSQPGICRRCFESRTECIFKTGPRGRRARLSNLRDLSLLQTPLPSAGQSKTFTIDMPVEADDPSERFKVLVSQHESFIDSIIRDMPPEDRGYLDAAADARSTAGSQISGSSLPVGASATNTPPSYMSSKPRAASSRSAASMLGLQPQFNLESAAALLQTFQGPMIDVFACIVLPEDITVFRLLEDRPFVLLAILAAASSSTSLQGHNLYDEEFRKLLGLKYVAGGERSLELLTGLVVYIAWYPFHLRPKNRQAFQYLQMAVEIINDLELDQDPEPENRSLNVSDERLENIRTFLAAYYLVCTFATTWNWQSSLQFTPYVKKCCDILEHRWFCKGDGVLAWQVRLQRIIEETNNMRRDTQAALSTVQMYQQKLISKGMESELDRWETLLPQDVSASLCIRIQFLQSRVLLAGAPLLKYGTNRGQNASNSVPETIDAQELRAKVPLLRQLFSLYVLQTPARFNSFSCICWSSMILSLILGYRMSFPLPGCEGWDHVAVRRELNFGACLEAICQVGVPAEDEDSGAGTPASSGHGSDILSATQVALRVLQQKYNNRVAARFGELSSHPDGPNARDSGAVPPTADITSVVSDRTQGPLTAGLISESLPAYYPFWEQSFTNSNPALSDAASGTGMPAGGFGDAGTNMDVSGSSSIAPPMGMDPNLWAMMTMGWSGNVDETGNVWQQ